ncbi:MAG: CopD family protein, partial [Miltoncostaeaceae bacterium]
GPQRARAGARGRRVVQLVLGGWALGLVLVPPAVLWTLGAGVGELGDLLLGTRAGLAWWAQVAGLAVAAAALLPGWRRGAPAGPSPVAAGAAVAGAGLALCALSWGGHASGGNDAAANIAIDALHNLATGAWVGGLLALVALWPAVLAVADPADRVRLGAAVVVRFSTLAVLAVAALVVTGIYRALAELGSAADLLDTGYGLALLVKLGLFGVLLALGALNRFVLHPRLERAALGLDDSERGAGALLARSVRAELVLAAAVVVAVAVMIGLPPPS